MEKLRVYTVSILAFKPRVEVLPDNRVREASTAYQLPGLIPAEHLDAAGEAALGKAFEEWPRSEGYYGHQAAVIPVTKQFFDLADEARKAGAIEDDVDEGPGRVFPRPA